MSKGNLNRKGRKKGSRNKKTIHEIDGEKYTSFELILNKLQKMCLSGDIRSLELKDKYFSEHLEPRFDPEGAMRGNRDSKHGYLIRPAGSDLIGEEKEKSLELFREEVRIQSEADIAELRGDAEGIKVPNPGRDKINAQFERSERLRNILIWQMRNEK